LAGGETPWTRRCTQSHRAHRNNACIAITTVDIANDLHITPRAIQLMFQRHRDCTPMGYLRRCDYITPIEHPQIRPKDD